MADDLFSSAAEDALSANAPLAARLRPRTLDDIVGQEQLLGAGQPLRTLVEADRLSLDGYRVEVEDDGWRTRLELATPSDVLYRGPVPGRRLTARGALSLFAGPFVLLALAVAVVVARPLALVCLLLAAACTTWAWVAWAWGRAGVGGITHCAARAWPPRRLPPPRRRATLPARAPWWPWRCRSGT